MKEKDEGFRWSSTEYNQAPTFIEIYDGFTMDVADITTIKKYKSKAMGKFHPQWYVVVSKKEQRIQVIETEDEELATKIYKKLNLIVEATSKAFAKATHEVKTVISHENKTKCRT